jgi:hypothetical protein
MYAMNNSVNNSFKYIISKLSLCFSLKHRHLCTKSSMWFWTASTISLFYKECHRIFRHIRNHIMCKIKWLRCIIIIDKGDQLLEADSVWNLHHSDGWKREFVNFSDAAVECKTNTLPTLMHQMRILTTQVSSVLLRSKKMEIRKKGENCERVVGWKPNRIYQAFKWVLDPQKGF